MNTIQKIEYRKILGSVVIGVAVAITTTVSATEKTIQQRYADGESIKILIVPGHDDTFTGTKYKNLREADLNVSVAEQIAAFLRGNAQFDVTVSRNDSGYYSPLFDYFQKETSAINDFITSHAERMRTEIAKGDVIIPKQVPHANASKIPLYRLYATNKWATEQQYDLVIHVHFNDEGRSNRNRKGRYQGYSVYVPDDQLLGAKVSRALGTAIAVRLKRDFVPSTMPLERNRADKNGVVSDMKLIALGANKTIAIPRALIEYGYIYEELLDATHRDLTTDVMAAATYYGILDFVTYSQ